MQINYSLLPGIRNVQYWCSASNGFWWLLPRPGCGHGPDFFLWPLWRERNAGTSNQCLQRGPSSHQEKEISERKRGQDYSAEQSCHWHIFQDYISQCVYRVQLFLLGFVHMKRNHYKLDIILCMTVALCSKNNAKAVQEMVESFWNWLLCQTEAGLFSSKPANEKFSWACFFSWTVWCFIGAIKCTRYCCSSTEAICSLREPFITHLNR